MGYEVVVDKEKCEGCEECVEVCPVDVFEMEDGKSCGFCHNGKKAFSVAEDCTTCHAGDIVFINEDAGNITFTNIYCHRMHECSEGSGAGR